MSRGSCPIRTGASSSLTIAASPCPGAELPTPALASPWPIIPHSVSTRTSTVSKVSTRPKSETCCRSGGIGTCSQVAWTLAMRMKCLLPWLDAACGLLTESASVVSPVPANDFRPIPC
jgi:hypothetical protein